MTNSTQAAEEKRWRDAMGRKSKLRTYRTVKDKLRFEPYLNFDSRHARILLTRCGVVRTLRIDRGRYETKLWKINYAIGVTRWKTRDIS